MTGERGKGDEDDDIKNYSLSSSLCVFYATTKTWEEKSIQGKNKSSSSSYMKDL